MQLVTVQMELTTATTDGGLALLALIKAKMSLREKAIVELDGHLGRNMRPDTSEQEIRGVQTHISFVGRTVYKAIRGEKGDQHAAVGGACQSQTNGVPVPAEAKAQQNQVFDSFGLQYEG